MFNSRIKQVLYIFVLLTTPAFVLAQTSGMQEVPDVPVLSDNDRTLTAKIADINLTNVIATTTSAGLSGKFTLVSSSGSHAHISYGFVIYDAKNRLVDAVTLGKVPQLLRDENKVIQFENLPIPSIPKGGKLVLAASNEAGVPVGAFILSKVLTLPQDLFVPITCSQLEKSIDCASLETIGSEYEVMVKSSLFGNAIETKKIIRESGKGFTVPLSLSPGTYYVRIVSKNLGVGVVIPFRVDGVFAKILSLQVSQDTNVEQPTLVLLSEARPRKGLTAEIIVRNAKDAVCYESVEDAALPIIAISLPSTCQKGFVTATILDSTKKVLTTKTEAYSVISFKEDNLSVSGEAKKANALIWGIGSILGAFFISGAGVWYIRSRAKKNRNTETV